MPSARNTVRPGAPLAPIRLAQFTRAFYLGGTEVQVVELLRGLRPPLPASAWPCWT